MHLEPTSSFGCLFVDEKNGYIGLCKTSKYNPQKCKWYSLTEIENVGLYCTKPRMDWKHRVLVDCEIIFDVPSQNIQVKRVVRSRIYCQHHRHALNSRYEEWSEPGSIAIMREIINQAYINMVQNEIKMWQDHLYAIESSLCEQARCAFMLPMQYTKEMVEQRYTALSAAFESQTNCIRVLEKYHKILLEAL
jgi:hypothetical protein